MGLGFLIVPCLFFAKSVTHIWLSMFQTTVTKSAAAASKTSGHTQASPATAESMDDPTGEEADVDEPKTDNYVGIKRQVAVVTGCMLSACL